MNELDNSYALIIGVGGTSFRGEDDSYMIADAKAIYDLLVDENIAGYKPENVILLTGKDASRAHVLQAFDDLKEKVNEESKVLIYFSGHGDSYPIRDKDSGEIIKGVKGYYLMLNGFSKEDRSSHIKADELKKKLNALIAERLVFFFDCCHAQGMTKGSDLLNTTMKLDAHQVEMEAVNGEPVQAEGVVQEIDDEEGMAIISACKDQQTSLRFKDHDYGLFTTCLLEVLKGEHARYFEDPYIRITDVVKHLIKEVPKRAATRNYPPNSKKSGPCQQNPFINLQFDKDFELSKAPKEKLIQDQSTSNGSPKFAVEPEVKKEVVKAFRQTDSANNALIFVHGFSGEAHNTFGQIPQLLAEDEKMDGWNMYPFGFNPNVNPQMGKVVWATVQDITRIADNLSSAIKHKFGHYDRIAIVAYSLGGLVAQRAILNLDEENRDRLSHLVLMATPSNGITNNAIKKLWKNKINELIQGEPFITQLRTDWDTAFNKSYPFDLKVVAATKDEFVSKASCLDPFDQKYWITVSGDHFGMVNTNTRENDSYQLILDTLTDNEFFNRFTDEEEVNLVLGEYDAIIRKLEPKLEALDERGLEKLIHALEGSGRSDDAINILETHPIAQNDSDMLRNLGHLYKYKYLEDSLEDDGRKAFKCYKKAYKLAKKDKDKEDVYLSAINLAFLNLMLDDDQKEMRDNAKKALKLSKKFKIQNAWNLATKAEAYLYLGDMKKAKKQYAKAAKKAGIKDKIGIYNNAYTAYVMLMKTEDPNDDFIKFMNKNFLS